jgi:hypothetical protein
LRPGQPAGIALPCDQRHRQPRRQGQEGGQDEAMSIAVVIRHIEQQGRQHRGAKHDDETPDDMADRTEIIHGKRDLAGCPKLSRQGCHAGS